MPPESPRIGILGLGSIGMRHARNLIELGCSVVGFDPAGERRALLQQSGGLAADGRRLALDCDSIIIAGPSACHLADLSEAVALGRNCFVEKPLSHTEVGLSEILAAAAAKRLTVFVGFMLRFHACVREAKCILERGDIGRPLWARVLASAYLPAWRPHQNYKCGYAADPATGGVLFDDIHEIDLVTHLLGQARLEGAAALNSGTLEMPSEDIAQLLLKHESGALSSIHLDYCSRPPRREVEIMGSQGSLRFDLISRGLDQFGPDGACIASRSLPGSFDLDYKAEIRCFLDCLDGRAQPPCDGVQAARSLAIVIAARRLCQLPEARDMESVS